MTDLEKYFNGEFEDIDFKNLTVIEKRWIERSVDFNIWRMNQAMKECGKAVCDSMEKTIKVIKRLNIFEKTYHGIGKK